MASIPSSNNGSRRLIIRLSSLGDIVLATAALEADSLRAGVDWVVAQEFAPILQGHPRIRRLFVFDRKSQGLRGWWHLCCELFEQDYDEVFDLHSSLRSRLAQLFFLFLAIRKRKRVCRWTRVAKQRSRLWGIYFFKGFWPRRWQAVSWISQFPNAVGGTGLERPDLSYLVSAQKVPTPLESYLCVMPSAQWAGKRWPVDRFGEVIRRSGVFPVVLGTANDQASRKLVDWLTQAGIPHFSGIGLWSVPQVATVLARSSGYLGNDTGLAYVAEAVGKPAYMIFGPTARSMGFGPWRTDSKVFESQLWCRPCGKDGRACFRLRRRHLCLQSISVDRVVAAIMSSI